ncbi:DUF2059 domain-containing protein [Sphingopyxis sp.]|uniref:DUF2059 domain-containing protein n=1 Tax=Sphingopyxis sp. TaxID=1908224 RepID=UPI003D8117D7
MTNRGRMYDMSNWKYLLLAGTMAIAPLPAVAAQDEAPAADMVAADEAAPVDSEAAAADAKAKMQREMDQAVAMIEKMFDTGNLPPIDPARLTLAQTTTAALVPAGSLERMMDNLYGKMFEVLMGQMGGESDLMISIKTGVDSEQVSALDAATKAKIADVFDPHRKAREEQITRVVKPLISEVLGDMEPPMRAGMAKAYARKFTAAQLTDVNTFLSTPSGTVYANEWMAAQADPEVMLALIKAMPPLVTKFIDRAPQIEKDMKDLPKERQLADLSDAELASLARLMKVDVKVLKDQRDMWAAPIEEAAMPAEADAMTDDWDAAASDAAAEAADAAGAAADAAGEAVDAAMAYEDAAYDRSNWSEAERTRVADLEAAADAASSAALEAELDAVREARERMTADSPE